MARQRVRPIRRIIDWATDRPRQLKQQLHQFENLFYDALSGTLGTFSDSIKRVLGKGLGKVGSSGLVAHSDHQHPLPFYWIETLADLNQVAPPDASRRHVLSEGLWFFDSIIDGSNADTSLATTLYVPSGTYVRLVGVNGINSGFTTNSDNAAITIDNPGEFLEMPIRIANTGAGLAAELSPTFCKVANVSFVGNVETRGTTTMSKCFISGVVDHTSGTEIRMTDCNFDGVTLSTGTVSVYLTSCVSNFDSTATFFEVPAGIGVSDTISLVGCQGWNSNNPTAGTFVSIGADINSFGGGAPQMRVIGCSGGALTFAAVPAGATVVEGCRFRTITGLDRLDDDDVSIRATFDADGAFDLYPETPNGHQIYDEGNVIVDQRRKLQFPNCVTINDGDTTKVTAPDIGIGDANEVYTTNAAGTAGEWRFIVNANVDANAAIVVTKLAPGTAYYTLRTNAAGTAVEWALISAPNQISPGSANEVLQTNSGGTAPEWELLYDANIHASADIQVSKLLEGTAYYVVRTNAAGTGVEWGQVNTAAIEPGAANTILQTNAGGTATEWELLFNANVAPAAGIEITKLEEATAYSVPNYTGTGTQGWSTDPEVDSMALNDLLTIRNNSSISTPGSQEVSLWKATSLGLNVEHDDGSVHELTCTPAGLSGSVYHVVHREYETTATDTSQKTLATLTYSTPFGITHTSFTGPKALVGVMEIVQLYGSTGQSAWRVHIGISWDNSTDAPAVGNVYEKPLGSTLLVESGTGVFVSGSNVIVAVQSALNADTKTMVTLNAKYYSNSVDAPA